MVGGEADVQPANPPAYPIPNSTAIAELSKASYEAEEEHYKSGFEKNCLRLGEPLDRIEGEDSLEERDGILHAPSPPPPRCHNHRTVHSDWWWRRTSTRVYRRRDWCCIRTMRYSG
ncbi:hypothetical protein F0562_032107 [Nyssa sinensis]|uniref:Uncharacterized protein n=1 Tax=Nyssa sinensis TaxID=561372 RepID=A0A5J5AWA7_9ASTE|nr:hypothetical protein F0562_032107 [Nyssa sinensis]